MKSYWELSLDEIKKLDEQGIDHDLQACLEYNPQSFNIFDIHRVLAVWEGENDGDDWRWVIQLKSSAMQENKKFVFLQGGCDFTGWDCQSWVTSIYAKTALKAAEFASCKGLETLPLGESNPYESGLGHMLAMLTGTYLENADEVYENLKMQIKSEKKKTWREKKDKEFEASRRGNKENEQ